MRLGRNKGSTAVLEPPGNGHEPNPRAPGQGDTRKLRALLQQAAPFTGGDNGTVSQPVDVDGLIRTYHSLVESERSTAAAQNSVIGMICSRIPTDRLNNFLFSAWADSYDCHMGVAHDPAVNHLILQALELHKLNFGKYHDGKDAEGSRIFGNGILEMSCGTGTVIKLLCEGLASNDRKLLKSLRITANDISGDMQEKAREKLESRDWKQRPRSLEFTQSDVRDLTIGGNFDTAILSQTLHLISDLALLDKERRGVIERKEDNEKHRDAKLTAIRNAFSKLASDGHFILIDEWPAKITSKPIVEPLISSVFYDIFRPVKDRESFISIMKEVPQACFVGEVKARIDRDHQMYMVIYRKDPDRVKADRKSLPSAGELQDSELRDGIEIARKRAVARIYDAFVATDRHFIENYRPLPGETAIWTNFIPLKAEEMFEFRRDMLGTMDSVLGNRKYNAIVLGQVLHELAEERRRELVGKAISSLNSGGSLLFINEWPAEPAQHPISTKEFRHVENRDSLIFEGALRQTIMPGFSSGMYGYLYRKTE